MIRRHPQRPQRRQHQDFHFFAAGDPTTNIESQFAHPPQLTPASPASQPEPVIQPPSAQSGSTQPSSSAPPIVEPNSQAAPQSTDSSTASLIQRAAAYMAAIDDPRELLNRPRPAFMDEIEALAASRPSVPAKVATKSAPSKARAGKTPASAKRRGPGAPNPAEATLDRSHHERHCKICTHRERAEIEADFIEWHAPDNIVEEYNISRAGLFRHARAVGLYALRNGNLRFALGRLIQSVDHVEPTADSIVRAIHHFARINDEGQWVEPPAHVIVSSGGIRREAAAGGHRTVAISLDSPALPGVIDVPPGPLLSAAPEVPPRLEVLPETAERVETDATR